MSRGYSLFKPKELNLSPSLCMYDGCGWLWTFSPNRIVKFFVEELIDIPQIKIDEKMNELYQVVSTAPNTFYSGVLVDDYFFITPSDIFSEFLKINVHSGKIEKIKTPKVNGKYVEMNSNIHFEASKLWMVTNDIKGQSDDGHKMYYFDIQTNRWDFSLIGTRKQQEMFNVWSFGGDYVYVSNWTNFGCSYFNKITGQYLGEIEVNGYPGKGADRFDRTGLIPSYGGMISEISNSNIISHSYNSLIASNEKDCNIAYVGPNYIWFQGKLGFGRIDITDKSVIMCLLSSAEDLGFYSELPEIDPAGGDNKVLPGTVKYVKFENANYLATFSGWIKIADTNILRDVSYQTVDSDYVQQNKYSIKNNNLKGMTVIPSYTYLDSNFNSKTTKEKIVLWGDKVTIFTPEQVRFVFDIPNEKSSGIFCTGKAMISTGDTDYIGEFK